MAVDHRNPLVANRKLPTSHSRSQRPMLSKRLSTGPRSGKKIVRIEEKETDEDNMATSFLQYCATCEKQIIVPNNAILYCSESCRKKDNSKTLLFNNAEQDLSPPVTPLQTFSFDDFPVRDIIPQRSPTAATHAQNRLSYSSMSEDEALYEDERRSLSSAHESEAERYLRHFRSSEDQSGEISHTPRPLHNRSSTALSTISQAPSLSHSPTSTFGMSMPYTPSTSRPLPPRTNPFSTSYKYSRSIDLVNPFAITPIVPQTAPSSLHHRPRGDPRTNLKSGAGAQMSNGVAEGEMLYEKMIMNASLSPGQGSLKQLFRFNEMQAPPTAQTVARYSADFTTTH